MKKNMGSADRVIRLILAAVFALLYFTGTITGTLGIVLLVLGGVLTVIAAVFHGLLGAFGGVLSRFFAKRPSSVWLQKWGLATVLTVLAVRLAVMSRPN